MTGYSTPATAGELTGPRSMPEIRSSRAGKTRMTVGWLLANIEAPLADEAKAHVMESWLMRRLDPAALDDLGEELALARATKVLANGWTLTGLHTLGYRPKQGERLSILAPRKTWRWAWHFARVGEPAIFTFCDLARACHDAREAPDRLLLGRAARAS